MNKEPLLFVQSDAIFSLKEGTVLWVPGVFGALGRIRRESPMNLAWVGKEDPYVLSVLRGEGILFDEAVPGPDAVPSAFSGEKWDIPSSVSVTPAGGKGIEGTRQADLGKISWHDLACAILGDSRHESRRASVERVTKETRISLSVNLDGTGEGKIETGIGFFDHMLSQIVRHTGFDFTLSARGDLEVDEHHTVEDVGIVLGQAILQALGDKRGISRYGAELLPMDDVLATVAIDFSGRPDFIWDCTFGREYIGTFPTEMVQHFFKSFSDAAACNLVMKVTQGNAHHMAEALFKGFAHAVRQACRRYYWTDALPSTKGAL